MYFVENALNTFTDFTVTETKIKYENIYCMFPSFKEMEILRFRNE